MDTKRTTHPKPESPGPQPAAQAAPTRCGALRALIRGLVDFGVALLATLQHAPSDAAVANFTYRFGTRNIALIIARITRGLMLAGALDDRLVRNGKRLDNPPARTVAARRASAPVRRARLPVADDDAALLARLPTAQEIAAQIRRQPIGVVLEGICRDLGIDGSHPLWGQIQQAVLFNDGSVVRVMRCLFHRLRLARDLPLPALAFPDWRWPTPAATTGPPLAATA